MASLRTLVKDRIMAVITEVGRLSETVFIISWLSAHVFLEACLALDGIESGEGLF